MVKPMILLAFVIAPLAACAEREPEPQAQPRELQLLLSRLDNSAELPPAARDKLARAERLVAPLDKLDADKIDPSVAEALVAR